MSIPGVFFEFTSWTSWSMKQHLQGLWSDGNAIKCKDKYKFSSPKSISVAHKNRWRSLYLDTSDKHGEPFSFLFNALGFLGQGLSMIIRWGSFTRSFPIHINRKRGVWKAIVPLYSTVLPCQPPGPHSGSKEIQS